MEKKEFEPFFDLKKVSGIAEYVKHCIEEYYKDPSKNEPKVLEKLGVVFSSD